MNLDANGFYKPIINHPEECIECNLCLDVCACNHQDLSSKGIPLSTMATWSNNPITRENCSSGGVGYEIAKKMLESGYKVAAVKYNIDKKEQSIILLMMKKNYKLQEVVNIFRVLQKIVGERLTEKISFL